MGSGGDRKSRTWAARVVACACSCGFALAAGCGWTPRDEHLAHQSLSMKPQNGDGSRYTTRLPTDPFRTHAGASDAEAVSGR